MDAAEIMTRQVVTVAPCATTSEIATAMADGAVSDVLVCEADDTLVGIVGDDDLVRYLERARQLWRGWWTLYPDIRRGLESLIGTNSVREAAWDLMRADLLTAREKTPVADIVEMMLDHDISCIPVVRDGKLVGVVTRTDLLKTLAPGRGELADARY